MRSTFPRLAILAGMLLSFRVANLPAAPLWRVMYEDDPVLEFPRDLVARAYGGHVWILPVEGVEPRRPVRKPGVVLHLDPKFDPPWVTGDRNPQVEYARLKARIPKLFPGIGDVEDKWHEYRFLCRVAPGLAPPEMALGTEFSGTASDPGEAAQVRSLVGRALETLRAEAPPRLHAALRALDTPRVRRRLERLEVLRRRIHARLGRALVKIRKQDHSEGRIPKTNHDWVGTYLRYLLYVRPHVDRASRKVEGTTLSLQGEIVEYAHIEGRVLEFLLDRPSSVIVQTMIDLEKEVRVHVVEGEILSGTSFLRFYPLGGFLAPEEIARVEEAVRKHLIARLPRELRGLSMTPDISIERHTGKLRVLDFNAGLFSGYYFPEEDLFTTSLLAERLSGERAPFLVEWDAVRRLPIGKAKVEALKGLRQRWSRFLTDDVAEAFWDRVFADYRQKLADDPTPERFAACLSDFLAVGLRTPSNYLQFAAEVQAAWPTLRLDAEQTASWASRLGRLDPALRIFAEDGRLRGEDPEDDPPPPPPRVVSVPRTRNGNRNRNRTAARSRPSARTRNGSR